MEENKKPTLYFSAESEHEYILYRKDIESNKISNIYQFKDYEKTQKYTDYTAKSGVMYEYYLKICRNDNSEEEISNSVKLMSF